MRLRLPGLLLPGLLLVGLGSCLGLAGAPARGQTAAPPAARAPAAAPQRPAAPPHAIQSPADGSRIVAIVNGDVITLGDVDNRRRLFALSTGLGLSPDVLDRLNPQIIRLLIDERLRLQEIERRHIVVPDADIAAALRDIEQRNNMPPGTLRRRLAADNVDLRTMIDQLRVQIGWTRLLREVLSGHGQVSPADIADRQASFKAEIGQPEYRVGDIFVPIEDPAQAADAERFADTIIQQLRAGAPFPVVAAQFSQNQTALSGGDLGWVQANGVDPEVLHVLQEMPVGAVSNPIPVPGGIDIVTLAAKRQIGQEQALMATVRQAFFPFATRLDPQKSTDAQRKLIDQARTLGNTAKSCDEIEAANKAQGEKRPSNPGELRVDTIGTPVLRQLVATLPIGKASEPLIADDGVAVVMVCTRDTRAVGMPNQQTIAEQILTERAELTSRQMMRDLRRRAVIDMRQ